MQVPLIAVSMIYIGLIEGIDVCYDWSQCPKSRVSTRDCSTCSCNMRAKYFRRLREFSSRLSILSNPSRNSSRSPLNGLRYTEPLIDLLHPDVTFLKRDLIEIRGSAPALQSLHSVLGVYRTLPSVFHGVAPHPLMSRRVLGPRIKTMVR